MAVYVIKGQYPDVEVVGPSKTQNVQVIQAQTTEHNVYFETSLPRNIATTANIKLQVNGLATHFEQLFDIAGVADVQWAQEATPAGLLEDHVIVFVSSTSGESQGQLDFPYSRFANDIISAAVANLRAGLDATEAL